MRKMKGASVDKILYDTVAIYSFSKHVPMTKRVRNALCLEIRINFLTGYFEFQTR